MKKYRFYVAFVATVFIIVFWPVLAMDAQWKEIIGIPKPAFGIDQEAPSLPNPWNMNVPGFYYIQINGSNAGNGYPGNPRPVIPSPIPAGSVVVVKGDYSVKHEGTDAITCNGTIENPIFIMGSVPSDHGVFTEKVEFEGSYYIIEYMDGRWTNASGNGKLNFSGHHGVVRHGDFRGDTDIGIGGVNPGGSYMVIWNCSIHHSGNVLADFDQDNHGTGIYEGDHFWIVHNTYYANSGDGIQLNSRDNSSLRYVYIGGNVSHHNKQTGMWTKKASDVIFSQNRVYGHRESNSSMGDGMGMQYGPEYIWFIFNTIYDNECGIRLASDSGGDGTHHFIIGNLIYNIHKKTAYDIENSWETAAIAVWGSTYTEVVSNTIWDVDAGINSPRDRGYINIVNNILGKPSVTGANTVWFYEPQLKERSLGANNLFETGSRIKTGSSDVFSYDQVGWQNVYSTGSPGFLDPAGGNYDISADSPAIGRGTDYSVYAAFRNRYGVDILKDIAQRLRPQNGSWDIGAYEFPASSDGPPQAPRNVRVLF